MSACQEFKRAFLQQAAELGLTPDETHEVVKAAVSGLLEKQALPSLESPLALYFGVPAAVGAIGGYGLAKGRELFDQDEDVGEIKDRETMDAYRLAARQAKLRQAVTAHRNQQVSARPLLR